MQLWSFKHQILKGILSCKRILAILCLTIFMSLVILAALTRNPWLWTHIINPY